ncbi:hypothetical protein LB534_06410 [Mesorhizobium sp. CA18]|uniref:hypothetical protein n=1 Tax=unclassified Mesorhizobium TaxID=325217 RepID=UPI000BAFC1AC|nr:MULTISPECIES: hypothetical protein [unclassified Mesorhizobium]MBZ9732883.1 hypothetical protein [Mesorhizobium sp. CA9]MBZ9824913.1 hypothetical protein [Mesorhizobium sp. CA18]MBZ9830533.1 hypothetical protein [Mesorhizobium sp. CA2]MBZ9836220.1 hypothetical protein [Mesorhizobium sp. CA3]MBZ9859115.1 hypothetical protein [Mesorhizobium sp. CA12]
MITIEMKPPRRRRGRWFWSQRKIVAVFSYRYDQHLVPDLIANLEPVVDGWIAYDDRASEGLFSSEPQRRRALIAAAHEAGADWVLAMDPDERLEQAVAGRIGRLTSGSRRIAWGFRCRELYTPASYRIDGRWGQKMQHRLFAAYPPDRYRSKELHGAWFPDDIGFRLEDSGLNLYHLKMIEPKRRAARRDLYNCLDPDRRLQQIGYDYLADESGMVLEAVPAGREYVPAHADDGGLWMADLSAMRRD